MVAPTIDRRETFILYGNAGAPENAEAIAMIDPQFDSADAIGSALFAENGSCFQSPANSTTNNHIGGRLVLGTTYDLTSRKFVYLILIHRTFNYLSRYPDDWSNGGVSIYFFDSLGNYSEFYVCGGDFPNDTEWQSFRGPGEEQAYHIIIDRNRTPDSSSGTLDWADISGMEMHHRHAPTAGSVSPTLGIGVMGTTDGEILTDGETANRGLFSDFRTSALSNTPNELDALMDWISPPTHFSGAPGTQLSCRKPFEIGDGTTHTEFEDFGTSVLMFATAENAGPGEITNPCVLLDDNFDRKISVNLSSDDYHVLQGTIFSGRNGSNNDWGIEWNGSSSEVNNEITNVQILNSKFANLISNIPTSGMLCDNVNDIEINTLTVCTGLVIRNCAGKGLYVTGGPANYSAITVTLEDSFTGDEITIADGAAGTYDLSGINASHTINVHNESATSAVTVVLPAGITATTSTAGGNINIDNALSVNLKIKAVDASDNSNIENARVRLVAESGGPESQGTVLLEGLTNSSGELENSYTFTSNQPVSGTVRKATNPPFYKAGPILGTINSSGFESTIALVRD